MSNYGLVKLKDLIINITDNRGKTPPLVESGIELIETPSLRGDNKYVDFSKISKYVSRDTYETWFRSGHPKNGDILITLVGTIGKVCIFKDSRGCIAQNIVALEFNERCNSEFMYYYLSSPIMQNQISFLNRQSAQPNLKLPDFINLPVNLPPLKEQQKIAEILSSVDAAIEKTEQVIAKTQELKAGITDNLLFNDIFSNYKISEICDLIDGDRSNKYPKKDDIRDEGILFLNTSNIKNHRLNLDNCNFISQGKFDELSKGKLKYNDVIITLRGTIGNVALFNCNYETGFINAQMSIMRAIDSKVLPDYLYYLMSSRRIQGKLKEVCTGSAQPQLPLKILKEVCIPIPCKNDQQKICDMLNQFVDKLDVEYEKLEKLLEIKKGLMQQLLTGQTRVKVD